MDKQQPEPYAGVAVPVEAVAQESLPLPTMQAFTHPAGSIMHVQLADGRILKVNVPPGTPPGHQIHFPVPAAGPIQQQPAQFAAPPPLVPAPQQLPPPPPVVSQPGVGVASVSAPETVTVQVPPGLGPGSIFRVTLTDGRPLDVTVPHGVPPGAPLTIPVPPWPVDREGRPLARIKKQPTFHFCGLTGSDASCCQLCFFIFCCPFAMLAACNGNL